MQDSAVVTLDSLGFKVASYQKSDQAIFGSRFGSAAIDENDLTLLKATTFRAGSNGSYSVKSDILTPYIVSGAEYNPIGYLKKSTARSLITTLDIDGGTYSVKPTAQTYWGDEVITAIRKFGGGAPTNKLYKQNTGGGAPTEITLPATLLNSAYEITSFVPFGDALLIFSPIANSLWYLNSAKDTVTAISTTGWTLKQGFSLNNKVYCTDLVNTIMEYTGNLTTASLTVITTTYRTSTMDYNYYPSSALNGRLYIGFPKVGLWCFDGVRAYEVLTSKNSGAISNFAFVCTSNGYIYTNKGSSLYRFNGSSVERMYDFPSDMYFKAGCDKDDNVYFITASGGGIYEASIKGTSPIGTYGYRLFKYDGMNIYEIDEYALTTGNNVAATHVTLSPSWFGVATALSLEYTPPGTGNHVYFNEYKMSIMYSATTDPMILSFQDADFNLPSIDKKINSFQFVFQNTVALIAGSKTLKIYYRLDETAAWTLCKTFSGVDSTIYSGLSDVDIPACKRIFFRCDLDGANMNLTRFSVYYLVIPPLKYQWNLLLNPATNTLEAPSAYDNTYFAKLAALRTAGTKFTYVDLNAVSYNVIVDSFVQKIDPTYSGTGNNYESQFSVVLREV